MELNWKEDNNLVRKIAKILLGDTLPNGEPVSSLVLIDAASRAELQRWADMSDAEFEAARQSGDTIHIDVDDEIKRITEEYGLDPNFLDDLLAEFDEDADDDMEIFSDAESEIDQDLLAEIEEWKQQEHNEPEGYYFSNPDPYLKPAPLPPDNPTHNFWFDEDGHIRVKIHLLSGCRSSLCRKRLAAQSTPSQALMTERKRWIRRWSALWLKSLQKSWRIANDKFTESWYNRSNQSCTGSCPFEGGNRNVTGN